GVCAEKWATFTAGGIGLGSLVHWARQDGWEPTRRTKTTAGSNGVSSDPPTHHFATGKADGPAPQPESQPPTRPPHTHACDGAATMVSYRNYSERIVEDENGKEQTIKIGLGVNRLCADLAGLTGGWPKRVDTLLFTEGAEHRPLWLSSSDSLFAWIGRRLG